MSTDLKVGDRVRLTAKALAMMAQSSQRRSRSLWIKRIGTIVRVTKVTDMLFIKWDDRASVDQWPSRACERAS